MIASEVFADRAAFRAICREVCRAALTASPYVLSRIGNNVRIVGAADMVFVGRGCREATKGGAGRQASKSTTGKWQRIGWKAHGWGNVICLAGT